jgi:hypothetical protein
MVVVFSGGCLRRAPVGDPEKPKQIQFFYEKLNILVFSPIFTKQVLFDHSKNKNSAPARRTICFGFAERGGFEPPVPF